MTWAVVAVVVIPLAGGLLAFMAGPAWRSAIAIIVSAATASAAVRTTIELWNHGPIRYGLGGWNAPLGIEMYVDGLGATMLLISATVGSAISLYAVGYFGGDSDEGPRTAEFWPLWLVLWAGINGVFVAADLFNLYVVFEIVSVASIALVTLAGKPEALRAAMRYLIAAFIGSLCYLLGVALLYADYGVLDLFVLGEQLTRSPATVAAFALIATGLMLKTALFPLHFWLPPAHAMASAPVSAALSALVIKTSFFVLIRIWFVVYPGVLIPAVAHAIGILGAIAILWGSFQALRQRRLKLLIAHSTVAQVGYMFLLFPLTVHAVSTMAQPSGEWLNEAWTGVTFQVISHALAKGALFLAAGSAIHSLGTDRLGALRGLYRRLPISTFAIALAGVSLTGLPPSAGFAAKWLIIKAAIGSGQWWWIPVIVIGGLLTAGYVVLILRYALGSHVPLPSKRHVGLSMQIAALLLAVLSIAAGFRLEEPLQLLIIGTPFPLDLPAGPEAVP
jgi:multicomponent Na+:H+ antiporter subunit D